MPYYGYRPGFGYGYGFPVYNPYVALPILKSDYRMGGLLNEYSELDSLSARNNTIYMQNMIEDTRCKQRNCNQTIIVPPSPLSVLYQQTYATGYPSYISNIYNPYMYRW